MAYPKTTDETKRAFIAQVINQLNERGENKKEECLRKHANLHKQYEAAQRYSREMKTQDEEAAQSPIPPSIGTETAPTMEVSTFPTTQEQPQEVAEYAPIQGYQSPYKRSKSKTTKQLVKARRKELSEKHYELLEWVQCIDDRIIKDTPTEARRMVNVFVDYADRLDELIKEKFHNRAINLHVQFIGITASMQQEEIEEIKRQAEMLAQQNAK